MFIKIPKMKPIKMAADPICDGQHAGGPARSEWLLAKDDGSLRNVFVYVEDDVEKIAYANVPFFVLPRDENMKQSRPLQLKKRNLKIVD